ncbi:MAG TPA: fimbrial protein [Morganella sp. (in: Bacteria)]|nr:fimbrial protein [Morganella sp. (in: enterobacteria)]
MKLTKLVLGTVVASTLSLSNSVFAADKPIDQGHGKVNFHGFIIDAPCSISPESVDQTVELGQIATATLKQNGAKGESSAQTFQIELVDCDLSYFDDKDDAKSTVNLKFTGSTIDGDDSTLAITGQAKGAGVRIMDKDNSKLIRFGETTNSAYKLQDGQNSLQFAAYVRGLGKADAIVPGEFFAVTNFTLTYE